MGNTSLLIVEDDYAVRVTIMELMQMHGYSCYSASNGEEALRQVRDIVPALIICDVNMPVMDGNDFTKKLRSIPAYAHIPVIMLTANVTEIDKIKGLISGAVDYITKPFNNNELVLKVGNILAMNKAFQENSWQGILADTFKANPNLDKQFVQSLYTLIKDNIHLQNYSVANLAADLQLSERNLYRKVKDQIGMPVATFIREVKLQRAHQMLENNEVKTYSRAASKVGFKSVAHFSKLYKERFK